MRRFTILGLMGLVLVLAVALAALRDANDPWAGGMILATATLVGLAALGAAGSAGARRARRLGFVLFGGGYFALAFLGLSEPNLARLPTSRLLLEIHQRVVPSQTLSWVITGSSPPGQGGTIVLTNINGTISGTPPTATTWAAASGGPTAPTSPGGPTGPSPLWKRLLPGAANLEAFSAVGHCVFALLAGLVGVAVGAWSGRRERSAAAGEAEAGRGR
jgi:hypothetical protein